MDDNVAIKVEHVSKKYCKSLKRSMLYGIKDIGRNMLGLSSHSEKLRKDEFWAVDDVSFKVKKGETLGIIGPNGSGKTTLLKMLNGIFWPDKGKITVRGRVGALIEVGAGFHPLLTGRENVYINAAILGMTKEEVDEKFDSIVEFADIGDFIDVPVKFYSSGMFVRLGFAVAVHCEPDILLIDEVLAVGDVAFQKKCLAHMSHRIEGGTSVLFVSHSPYQAQRICSSAILMEKGRIVARGNPADVMATYFRELVQRPAEQSASRLPTYAFQMANHRPGSGELRVLRLSLIDPETGKQIQEISVGSSLLIRLYVRIHEPLYRPVLAIRIYDSANTLVVNLQASPQARESLVLRRNGHLDCLVSNLPLLPGNYTLEFICKDGSRLVDHVPEAARMAVTGTSQVLLETSSIGLLYVPAKWTFDEHPNVKLGLPG